MRCAWMQLLAALLLCASCSGQEGVPGGVQRQTRLALPEVRPHVTPELVVLPVLAHRTPPTGLAFSRDGRTLASCSRREVLAWDIASRSPRWGTLDDRSGPFGDVRDSNYDPWVHRNSPFYDVRDSNYDPVVAVSGDGVLVAVVWCDRVCVWDTRTSAQCAVWELPDPETVGGHTPQFSPDGTQLAVPASAGQDTQAIRVFDARSGRLTAHYAVTGVESGVVASYRPDGTLMAVITVPIGMATAPALVESTTHEALPAIVTTGGACMSPDGRWVKESAKQRTKDGDWVYSLRLVSTEDWSVHPVTDDPPGPAVACGGPCLVAGADLIDLGTGDSAPLLTPNEHAALSPDHTLVATPRGLLATKDVLSLGSAGDPTPATDGVLVAAQDGMALMPLSAASVGFSLFTATGGTLVSCSPSGRVLASRSIGIGETEGAGVPSRSAWCVYRDNSLSAWQSADGVRFASSSAAGGPDRVAFVPEPAARCFVREPGGSRDVRFAVGLQGDGTVVSAGCSAGRRKHGPDFELASYAPSGDLIRATPDQLGGAGRLKAPDGTAVPAPAQWNDPDIHVRWWLPAFSPGADKLAFLCGDPGQGFSEWQTLVVFDMSTAAVSHALKMQGPEGNALDNGSLRFLADGRTLVVTTDRGVGLYDTETGRCSGRWELREPSGGRVHLTDLGTCAVSPEGSFAVTQVVRGATATGHAFVHRLSDGEVVGDVPPRSEAGLVSACFRADGNMLALSYADRITTLWDTTPLREGGEGRLLGTLVDGANGEWASAVPQGFIDCSLGAGRLLGWKLGGSVYPLEQFAAKFRRPDLVRRALAGEDISAERGLTGADVPPTATFLAPEYDATIEGETAKVEVEVAGVRPLARVDLLIDGRPIPDELAATAKWDQIEENHGVYTFDLPLSGYQRRTRLQAIVHDEDGLQSMPTEVTFTRAGTPPPATVLHALAVGVSAYRNEEWNNLKYADKDAESFAKVAGEGAARKVLLNEDATGSNVRFALEEMKASVTEDDIVAIFLAGHGTVDAAGNYYMLLHDSDVADLDNTALPWDDFVAALKAIRAKLVMVFADTCHSGSITGQESVNTLIDRLNRKAGVVVFTASRGDEASIEREDWGHGAFTKALLEGFSGEADTYPKDEQVSLAELRDYVIQRVEELTSGRQHPYLPRLEEFDPARPICNVIPGAP